MCKVYYKDGKYYLEDGQKTTELKVVLTHGKPEVKLPENSANRQFVMLSKIPDEGLELEPRVTPPRVLNTGKKLEDYMTDEERKTIDAIMEKCRQRKEADKPKELTEVEKLQAKIAKLQAKVQELSK